MKTYENSGYEKYIIIFISLFLIVSFILGSINRIISVEEVIIITSLLLGILSLWIPDIVLYGFLVGAIIIPNEVLPILSNSDLALSFGAIRLHPAGIVIFLGSFLNVLKKRKLLLIKIKQQKEIHIVIAIMIIFIISIFSQTYLFRGMNGLPLCLENYIFPFVFFLFLIIIKQENISRFLKIFVSFILVISILAVIEYIFKHNYLYHQLYANSSINWYDKVRGDIYRSTTTIGHPLKNSVYFLFSIPLCIYLYKKPFNIISIILLSLAILTTGSRVAFVLTIFAIVICTLRIKVNFINYNKLFAILCVITISIYLLLFISPLGRTLLIRFSEGYTSTSIRVGGINNLPYIIKNHFVHGIGLGLSYEVSSSFLKYEHIDFENPWIMMITDVGLITSLLYIFVILCIIRNMIKYVRFIRCLPFIIISFALILIMCSSFDSFGYRNNLNFLLWFNIGLFYSIVLIRKDIKWLKKSRV